MGEAVAAHNKVHTTTTTHSGGDDDDVQREGSLPLHAKLLEEHAQAMHDERLSLLDSDSDVPDIIS